MIDIKKEDINRINDFITSNELDYQINDNGIIRYHIVAYDDMVFYFYNYNDDYVKNRKQQ